MKDNDSIFGAGSEKLDRLLRLGLNRARQPQPPADAIAPVPVADAPLLVAAMAEQPGGRIGRYKLLRVLGEGGMGIVYLAEQQGSIRRRAALKVIKPGMDSARVLARFEAERQALALLDHPNIAHVYDAGTTDGGRPYFVMEYVKGLPITEHCDRHKLAIEQRLRLFQQVCHAVHHAHQKAIIHRDIKPSNILVAVEDDQSIPKIIDFGVAKAIAQPLTERTLITEQGQLFGTPEYMSPEQADMAVDDIDTRSDIYSLGVLLYVLLTGCLPFDSDKLRTGGIENIRKVIRQTDPETPSTRLTKLGEQATVIAQNRRIEMQTLTKNLHRELEWIPLKAMRKERSERYRSASELADDIENYLNGEPLIAGPPSTVYKLKKFVRRNRILVGGITTVLVVLVAGAVVSTIFGIGQARARAEADNALSEAQLITDFLENDVLGSADKATVNEATVIYTLDSASRSLAAGKFKDKPLIEARICQTLGNTYRRLGEYTKAEQHLLRAIDIDQKHLGEEHPGTLKAMGDIGWVYLKQGRHHEMEQLCTKLVQIQRDVHGIKYPIIDMQGLAVASYALGKYQQAESLFDELLQIVPSEDSFRILSIKSNLAVVYLLQGRYDEAVQLLTETIRYIEDRHDLAGTWRSHLLNLKQSLATTYVQQCRYDEAERLFEETLKAFRLFRGDRHPETLHFMMYFAQLRIEQERYNEAEDLLGEALSVAREPLWKDHPFLLSLEHDLARLKTRQGQYEEAETLFDRVLEGTRREKGEDHLHTLKILNDLGILRREQRRFDETESLLLQALEGRQRNLDPNHPACFSAMHELGVLYKERGYYDKAEGLLLKAVGGRRLKLGDTHPHTQESLNNLIQLYDAWNKPDEAEKLRTDLPHAEVGRR